MGDGPVLAEPLKDQTVVSPAAAKFVALVKAGEPRAEVKWFKTGKPVSVDGVKYTAQYDGDEASLTVDRCETADAGEFSFTATNKVASVSSKATLTVHGIYSQPAFISSHLISFDPISSEHSARRLVTASAN